MLTFFRDSFFFPDFIYTMRRLPRSGPFNSWQQITPRPRLHYAGGIWEQRFYFENVSNVFRPHDVGGIWKRRFYFENSSNVFRPHYTGEIWKWGLRAENASNVLRPHYTGEISKRRLHADDASKVSRPPYTGGIWKRRLRTAPKKGYFRQSSDGSRSVWKHIRWRQSWKGQIWCDGRGSGH